MNNDTNKSKFKAGKLIIAVVAVLAIGTGVFLAIKLTGGNTKGKDVAIFIKDKEIHSSDLKQKGETEIPKSKLDSAVKPENISFAEFEFSTKTRITKDGSVLFYPDMGAITNINTFPTYYYNIDKEDYDDEGDYEYEDASEEDDWSYESGNFYEDFSYYMSSIRRYPLLYCNLENPEESKQKISGSVISYEVDDELGRVIYLEEDSNKGKRVLKQYNIKDLNDETNKRPIADEAKNVERYQVSADKKVVVFSEIRDGSTKTWHLRLGEEKPSSIDSNCTVQHVSEDGKTVYYVKDDNLRLFTEGVDEKPKVIEDYAGRVATYASGEMYFYKKQDKESGAMALCVYDGKTVEVIQEYNPILYPRLRILAYSKMGASPVLMYCLTNKNGNSEYYIVSGKQSTYLGDDNIVNACINDEGTIAYYIVKEKDADENEGEMYKIELSGSKPNPEPYDKNVYTQYIEAHNGENVVYFKDYKKSATSIYYGELWMNKKRVDYDIASNYMEYAVDSSKLYYMAELEDNSAGLKIGTFKVYDGKELKTVSDDVLASQLVVTPEGNMLYLKEYDSKGYEGTLYYYDGENTNVAEDVCALLTPYK